MAEPRTSGRVSASFVMASMIVLIELGYFVEGRFDETDDIGENAVRANDGGDQIVISGVEAVGQTGHQVGDTTGTVAGVIVTLTGLWLGGNGLQAVNELVNERGVHVRCSWLDQLTEKATTDNSKIAMYFMIILQ